MHGTSPLVWDRTNLRLVTQLAVAVALFTQVALGQDYPGNWTGRWIWIAGEAHPYDYFLMARRDLELPQAPASARLHITASDRYVLYINGKYLGRGPARSDPRWKSFDTYDAPGLLRAGKNTVAVLAYHYGCANNYSRDERAGLFVQLEIPGAGGKPQIIGTDERWRVRPAKGWRRDVDPINSAVGVTEVYDANADPQDWTADGFDDSGWEPAFVIPQRDTPWGFLETRQTPMVRERLVYPQRIVQVGEVSELPPESFKDVQVPERLTAEPHYPLRYAKVEDPDAVLKSDGRTAVVQTSPFRPGEDFEKGVRSPFIIVDFGRQMFGFPRVEVDAPANTVIEMTYGPILVNGRVPSMLQGLRYGDRYVTRAGKQVWQTFEYKQFRYVQVVFRQAIQPARVDSIAVDSYEYPAARKGSFECSDPVLTKLWKAAVDTTDLHMEDALICDAVRERRVWTGDGAHGLYGIYAAYGDTPITDWFFRLIARGALADGMLRMFYPGTEQGVGDHERLRRAIASENPVNIPQFALFYGIFVGEHYRYFGKRQLARELYPRLVELAAWCERHAAGAGLLYGLPNWNFVDWVRTEMQGANFETNALYAGMLADMHDIASDLGRKDESAHWLAEGEKVRAALRQQHWNAEKGLFVDDVVAGKQSSTVTETANGMSLLFDIANPEQASSVVRRLADPATPMLRATPLYFYYTVEGLIRAGAIDVALRQVHERYQPMIDASDAPTIWETWPSTISSAIYGLATSFVHSGGVGPVWTLSKHVLGVYPEGPGFQKCRVEPQTGNLQWARGVFPSVRGDIRIEWRKEGNRFLLDTSLPDGLETDLALRREPGKDIAIVHNGKRYEAPARATSVPGLVLSDRRVAIKVVGGTHHVEMVSR